ncbi:MAG: hypothetical protein JWL57_3863 [Actinobacteria bacterium]|jgi:hypothetical protein|nr:hypothetical protein [Actinomycetota bacterium]
MRRLRVRKSLWISTVAMILGSMLITAPRPASANSSFNVQLATTQVTVDNVSDYPDARVGFLVQMADRGMGTTDPSHNNVAGEMQSGDRVVVTHYGIYWLDIVRRGGLLSGMWALVPSISTGADFQYVANANQWSPNEFLPGADGSNARIYDTGQGVNVLGTGGNDGSCIKGKGTFIIKNSFNCGIANSHAHVSFSSSVAGYEHLYTLSGTLYQEGTRHNTQMTDSYGNTANIDFTLTYRLRDYTDPNYDYGACCGPEAERVRVEVTLKPSRAIHLGTLVVAGNSDPGTIPYPYRKVNYSNTLRHGYGCNGGDFPPGTTATLCEGAPNATNWISEGNSLPQTLSQGNFVTEQQSSVTGSVTDREITYLLPYSSAYRLPERIDHIWNAGLGVSSMDVDYFNNEEAFVPNGGSLTLGFDLQMQPHP